MPIDSLASGLSSPAITFPPVGECIYCGTRDGRLTKEHVIPKALGGAIILPQATCDACSEITSGIERNVCRTKFGNLRITMGFPSYRKKDRPSTIKVRIYRSDGAARTEEVAVKDHPTAIVMPVIDPPWVISGSKVGQLTLRIWQLDKGKPDLARPGEFTEIIPADPDWSPFYRMLAKIGHSYIRGKLLLPEGKRNLNGRIPRFVLPEMILQKDRNRFEYVGCLPEETPHNSSNLHDIVMGALHLGRGPLVGGQWLAVKIRLFEFLGAPTYTVLVARLSGGSDVSGVPPDTSQ